MTGVVVARSLNGIGSATGSRSQWLRDPATPVPSPALGEGRRGLTDMETRGTVDRQAMSAASSPGQVPGLAGVLMRRGTGEDVRQSGFELGRTTEAQRPESPGGR